MVISNSEFSQDNDTGVVINDKSRIYLVPVSSNS